MEPCYLCEKESNTKKETDGIFVQCEGPCGPYIITQHAINDLKKIHGRKQGIIERIKLLRERDRNRRIRITQDSVSFAQDCAD